MAERPKYTKPTNGETPKTASITSKVSDTIKDIGLEQAIAWLRKNLALIAIVAVALLVGVPLILGSFTWTYLISVVTIAIIFIALASAISTKKVGGLIVILVLVLLGGGIIKVVAPDVADEMKLSRVHQKAGEVTELQGKIDSLKNESVNDPKPETTKQVVTLVSISTPAASLADRQEYSFPIDPTIRELRYTADGPVCTGKLVPGSSGTNNGYVFCGGTLRPNAQNVLVPFNPKNDKGEDKWTFVFTATGEVSNFSVTYKKTTVETVVNDKFDDDSRVWQSRQAARDQKIAEHQGQINSILGINKAGTSVGTMLLIGLGIGLALLVVFLLGKSKGKKNRVPGATLEE